VVHFGSGRSSDPKFRKQGRGWGAERAENAAMAGALQLRILAWGQASAIRVLEDHVHCVELRLAIKMPPVLNVICP
jgi:hypothetical protein